MSLVEEYIAKKPEVFEILGEHVACINDSGSLCIKVSEIALEHVLAFTDWLIVHYK